MLCDGLPIEFLKYMKYVRNLKFEEKPQYSTIIDMFSNLVAEKGFERMQEIEWVYGEESNRTNITVPQININVIPDFIAEGIYKHNEKKRVEDMSKAINVNSKSKMELSANEDKTNCTHEVKKKPLINMPRTVEIFHNKIVLDSRKYISSGQVNYTHADEIPDEKEGGFSINNPIISEYEVHNKVRTKAMNPLINS